MILTHRDTYSMQVQYSHSRSFSMSDGRDVPPISGQIIWLRQIESELEV